MIVLGIETSCDETSAAVVKDGVLLSNVIYSQIDSHRVYGGVVPEIAAREHMDKIVPVTGEALEKAGIEFADIDAIAFTYGPGLAGSLIVGISYAKAAAFSLGKKIIGINHLEGHLLSPFIEFKDFSFPYLGLVISGGHTNIYAARGIGDYELVASTRDDAAGEAFDKTAKLLGLPYPGGPSVSKAAASGDDKKIVFPQAQMKDKSFDFSFSGLKTSVLYYVQRNKERIEKGDITVNDIAAAFQKTITRSIRNKMKRILEQYGLERIAITGGVAANAYLKNEITEMAAQKKIKVYVPRPELCTDNGAMIAFAGYMRLKAGFESGFDIEASADLKI